MSWNHLRVHIGNDKFYMNRVSYDLKWYSCSMSDRVYKRKYFWLYNAWFASHVFCVQIYFYNFFTAAMTVYDL